MYQGKFLVTLVLCVGAANGAVITGGTLSQSQSGPSGFASSSGNFTLSDGVTVNSYHSSDGPLLGTCIDRGQGCSFSGFPVVVLGNTSIFSSLLGAFFTIQYGSSFTAVPGIAVQTFQVPFTLSGTVSKDPFPDPSCPFSDAMPSLGYCTVAVTGSGVATSTVREVKISDPSVLDGFYLSNTTYDFTSPVPEPATPILITAGIGVVALLRRRFSGVWN